MRNDQILYGFGMMASAMGGGGDKNNPFPASDAADLGSGARFIPGEVTMARRRGEHVPFVRTCGACCWHWELPNTTRIYHWARADFEAIAKVNGLDPAYGEAGPCPRCGNVHTSGGTHPV